MNRSSEASIVARAHPDRVGPETMGAAYGQVVEWAQAGKLTFGLERVPLRDIEAAWQRTDLRGTRLVVEP